MEAMLAAPLLEEARILFAKLQIREIGVQLFCLAERQLGMTVIVAVRRERPALKVARRLANGLQVLLGASQHGRQIIMILAVRNLCVYDDLMLAIDQRLRMVALDHPMRAGHFCRLIIRHVALNLFPPFPDFGFL